MGAILPTHASHKTLRLYFLMILEFFQISLLFFFFGPELSYNISFSHSQCHSNGDHNFGLELKVGSGIGFSFDVQLRVDKNL